MIYNGEELSLYGAVGSWPEEECFTVSDVRDALHGHGGDDLTVNLNSGGGYASDGLAIYNALKAYKGKIEIIVDGMAASAASLIAMAGDSIVMRAGAMMMIHDPAVQTNGTAADHAKSVEALTALSDGMAEIYARRSKKSIKDIRSIMIAETWYTATAAVAAGFADRVDTMTADAIAPFAYATAYHHPPAIVKNTATGRKAIAAAVAETNARMAGKPVKKEPKAATRLSEMMAEINKRRSHL